MPSLTCQTDGCERPILGRKLCATHYSKWYRTQRKYTIVCLGCGETVKVPRNTSTTCSRECAATVANAASQLAQASNGTTTRLTQCEWCWELFAATSIKKFCSDTCANNSATERARLQRSPLRAAIEDGDHDTAIASSEPGQTEPNGGAGSGLRYETGTPISEWGRGISAYIGWSSRSKRGSPWGCSQRTTYVPTPSASTPTIYSL